MSVDVQRMKTVANLVEIAEHYGIKLRKAGAQLVGVYPFHREKSASFQIFKCFGCCPGAMYLLLSRK